MKTLFLLFTSIFFLLTSSPAFAQLGCGTEITQEQMQAFYQRDKSHLELKASKQVVYIPVTYHLVADDSGDGAFDMSRLLSLHCSLVEDFEDSEVVFYIHDIVYHSSTYYYFMQDAQAGNNMFLNENVENTCNIFIVKEAKSGTTTVCGYSYLASYGFFLNGNGIVLNMDCSDYGSTTLTHEMGHYLNLPHTFFRWEGNNYNTNPIPVNEWERLDGSNCSFRGDGFCDTPPDYISERWNCFNAIPYTDPNGQSFFTDEKNFMSYSQDECMEYFKPEQQAEVNAAAASYRPYLLTLPVPDIVALNQVNLAIPEDNAVRLSVSNLFFSWDEVAGADYYIVQFTQNNFFNLSKEVVVTTNSVMLDDLISGRNYSWRVKGFTYANACAPFSEQRSFSTSNFALDFAVADVLCETDINGSVEVLNFTNSVNFEWALYDEVSNNFNTIFSSSSSDLTNLGVGTYQVIVTDNVGARTTSYFNVDFTANIQISISELDDKLKASATGGSAPYFFNWSNGQTDATNTKPDAGENELTVFDNDGCSTKSIFVYTPDVETPPISPTPSDTVSRLSFYPNPVSNGDLKFEILSLADANFSFKLYSLSGQKFIEKSYDLINGLNFFTVDLSNLSKGVYFMQYPFEEELVVKRIVIL